MARQVPRRADSIAGHGNPILDVGTSCIERRPKCICQRTGQSALRTWVAIMRILPAARPGVYH